MRSTTRKMFPCMSGAVSLPTNSPPPRRHKAERIMGTVTGRTCRHHAGPSNRATVPHIRDPATTLTVRTLLTTILEISLPRE